MVESGPKIPANWISKQIWNEVLAMDSQLPAFQGLASQFAEKTKSFRKLYDAIEAEKEPLPQPWRGVTGLQHLCFMRALRVDCLKNAVIAFVTAQIGQKFVEPPTFDIA